MSVKNKNNKYLILFFYIFFAIGPSSIGQTSGSYIRTYKPIADSLGLSYGIPSELILSIAILESGYGRSRNAKLLNNHFGIVGKNNLQETQGIKSRYKQYPSVLDSYDHFCKTVSKKKYYKALRNNSDCKKWVKAMKLAGYSEKPEVWESKVLKILNQVSLRK